MAVKPGDWKFLDDVLTSLSNKVKDIVKVSLPGDPTLAPISTEAAHTYLADVLREFNAVEAHILKLVDGVPESSPAYQLGHEIGRNLIVGAKRASKIAREVGSDLADTFDKTADRLEEGGLTIAKTFGAGLALAVIFALIWLGRQSK